MCSWFVSFSRRNLPIVVTVFRSLALFDLVVLIRRVHVSFFDKESNGWRKLYGYDECVDAIEKSLQPS